MNQENIMNGQELKAVILDSFSDIELKAGNHQVLISPWDMHSFDLSFDDFEKNYSDIDDLLSDKVIDGKSLNEIEIQLD
ncbi:hypothetical protein Q5O14_15085 [Eubacteriaceae bacterium ES2]|nr:hypothetical protein Q5O14_15085 [Eubacteriaceae bacterium ES2]